MTAGRSILAAAALSAALSAGASPVWVQGESLAPGVATMTARVETPRKIRFFAVKVDMKTADIGFVATGRASGWGRPLEEAPTIYDGHGEKIEPADVRTRRETPAEFLQKGGKGALFAFATRATRHPYSGDFADPRGLFIANGVVVSNSRHGRGPVFAVRRGGELEIADRIMPAEVPDILFAQTGDVVIRRDGRDVVSPERRNVAPCLAVGLSADRKQLFVVTADDGERIAGGTGADYHDMNDALETLGASDAISFEHGGAIGIFAAGKDGAPRQLNQLGPKPNAARVISCLGVTLGRPKGAGELPPKVNPAQVKGALVMPKVTPMKGRNRGAELTLGMQVKANLKGELPRIKRPVLSVSALFETDGLWRSYDVVLTDQKTPHGINISAEQTPAGVSEWQPEVTLKDWKSPVFGDAKHGLFKGCGISSSSAKLIAWRLELWQNGGLVAVCESDQKQLRKLGVPEDWHVKGKYAGKITYRWPPPPDKDKKK